MPAFIDMSGRRFGRLLVIGRAANSGRGVRWECQCDCGQRKVVPGDSLRCGKSKSCGCLQRETTAARNKTLTKHGMCLSPEYTSWRRMLARCYSPSAKSHKYYASRGITVCQRWIESFAAFHEDMGDRPSYKHSIDRIDNDGNYEPGNCRWATWNEQANNRRGCVSVTAFGVSMPMRAWSKVTGVNRCTIGWRRRRGYLPGFAVFKGASKPVSFVLNKEIRGAVGL